MGKRKSRAKPATTKRMVKKKKTKTKTKKKKKKMKKKKMVNCRGMWLMWASHGRYRLYVEALSRCFYPSVVWLLLIRHFVAAMPWIIVVLFNVLLISVTIFYYLKAGWIEDDAIGD